MVGEEKYVMSKLISQMPLPTASVKHDSDILDRIEWFQLANWLKSSIVKAVAATVRTMALGTNKSF